MCDWFKGYGACDASSQYFNYSNCPGMSTYGPAATTVTASTPASLPACNGSNGPAGTNCTGDPAGANPGTAGTPASLPACNGSNGPAGTNCDDYQSGTTGDD